MTNLLWPGDHRAGDLMSDQALLQSMIAVEVAWLDALVSAGVVPASCAGEDIGRLVSGADCEVLAATSEEGGNPVIGLVRLLRERSGSAVGHWIHRGLTSQDVLDSALMLSLRRVLDELAAQLAEQIAVLCTLADTHRGTPLVARTMTQHAVPTSFGAKAARWLDGVTEAYQRISGAGTPIQIGGAAGTLSAATELARLRELPGEPAEVAVGLTHAVANRLNLDTRATWHTTRTPVTAIADVLVGCTDVWGRIASDVVTLARPEIAELSEPATATRGTSSTMPQKRNPVLSILIRRAAIAAPPLAATLHTAAALANDERPDGSWHAEWDTLRTLARRTVVAGAQCCELVGGLQIHAAQMAKNLANTDVLGEQRTMADLAEKNSSATYFGAVDLLIDQAIVRAQHVLNGPS
ncbi:3-carboxy-cis,cis-muconate cycloisomerase [Mycolicibacterium cyprinidarum]|uniref:3-carboxy-cis,cis-muconate cycloisomerase n=1 Tax=Mycolicibacterium cyprinidarum TaxID=2860311 RepID=A0ABQ4V6F5_9MYCO|nr:3-carboxy-cis,cis-muconate cycloisomerase [Mycolicibacterium sp. NGTWSNA01]GJF13539.1 3-carboxy-cis,cis-muconate cycloisomerase [Mycolicibacterium sp. NGTWS0302]